MKFRKRSANRVIGAVCVIFQATAAVAPAAGPLLPRGPESVQHFGGYQTRLEVTPEWDAPWRPGPHSEVVVAFPDAAARVVFRHGWNYGLCMVTDNGLLMTDQSVERSNENGCTEHMSDKQNSYSPATRIAASDSIFVNLTNTPSECS